MTQNITVGSIASRYSVHCTYCSDSSAKNSKPASMKFNQYVCNMYLWSVIISAKRSMTGNAAMDYDPCTASAN